MKKYHHLTLLEREKLYAWKEKGLTIREIGKRLQRSHTTLLRELKRNTKYGATYTPCLAQEKTKKRLMVQRRKAALKDPLIFLYVREHLRLKWSPEQIAGRLPLDCPGYSINDETIYRYIYAPYRRTHEHLQKYLTLQRPKRMKKYGRKVRRNHHIPGLVSIDSRPKEVNERIVVGHWETDNVLGKQGDDTVISTTVERVTKMTVLAKLENKTAFTKTDHLIKSFRTLPQKVRKTLTVDNGLENCGHQTITRRLKMPVYFCHAYHAWEKGTVENMNGRIRRYIPKGVSIDPIPVKTIQAIEGTLNNTPRKCLRFKTPYEKMDEELQKETVY